MRSRTAGLSRLDVVPPLALAIVLAIAAFAALAPLPLDVREEGSVVSAGDLPPAARLVARLLGSAQAAWRALGAASIGLVAAAAGFLMRAFSRSRTTVLVAALVAGTNAGVVTMAADARGALGLLSFASAASVVGLWKTRRARSGVAMAALAWILLPPVASLPLADALARAVNRSAGSSPAALAGAAAVLVVVIVSLALSGSSRRASLVACAAAIAFAVMGIGTAARDLGATKPARAEARRFLARLDSVPALTAGAGVDYVANAPGGPDAVARARPSRPFARAPEALGTGFVLRLMKWAPPADDGLLAMQPPDLQPVIEATVDPAIRLLAPGDGASLAARSAEDEPEFRFMPGAVPHHDHAGDCCHGGGLKVIILSSDGTRTRVIERDLSEAILRREGTAEEPVLVWKPAWRPMDCPERELRWEDGEVCPPGGAFWWTIAVSGDDGARIAPFRRGFVQP